MTKIVVSKKNTCEVSKLKAQQKEKSNASKHTINAKSLSAIAAVIAGIALQTGCAMSPATDDNGEPMAMDAPVAVAEVATEPRADANTNEAASKVSALSASSAKKAPKAPSPEEIAAKNKQAADKAMAAEKARLAEAEAKALAAKEGAEKAKADAMMSSLAAKDKYAVIAAEPAPTATKAAAAKEAKAVKKAPAKARKALVKKALDVSVKDLPVTIGLWSIARNLNDNSLQIATPTWQMGDGSYLSQIWITLKDDRMIVNSSSDIDAKNNGSGVVLNGGELIPFTRIEDKTRAILEGDWMQQLSDGGSLELHMGFFPGKTPRSPTFKSEATLDALSRLVPTYENLNQ